MPFLTPVDTDKLAGDEDPEPPVAQADATSGEKPRREEFRDRMSLIRDVVAPGTLSFENERLLANVLKDFGAAANVDSVFEKNFSDPAMVGGYHTGKNQIMLSPRHEEADGGYVTKSDTTTPHNTLLHELSHSIQDFNIALDEEPHSEVEADIMAQVLAESYDKPQVPLQDSVRSFDGSGRKMPIDSLRRDISTRLNIIKDEATQSNFGSLQQLDAKDRIDRRTGGSN